MTPAAKLALEGVRILDMSWLLPGRFCTAILADLGADVIKIEDPDGGDDSRATPPFAHGESLVFLANNRNRHSICLDLKSEAGHLAALALIEAADVVVESFATGVMERLGLGADAKRALNPRLIYCLVSAFGRDGTLKDRPGYELMMQAFSGMKFTTGDAGGDPLQSFRCHRLASAGSGCKFECPGVFGPLDRERSSCAPVNALGQALAEDQLHSRGMVLQCAHPMVGAINLMAHPVTLKGTDKGVRHPPPRPGAPRQEILTEIGM